MIDSPKSLKEGCLEYVSRHFDDIFGAFSKSLPTKRKRDRSRKLKASSASSDFFLPSEIADVLIRTQSRYGKLSQDVLHVFSAQHACLREVILPNCKGLNSRNLQVLKNHKIESLEVSDSDLQFNEIIQCMGDWSRKNLSYLKVQDSIFFPFAITSVPFGVLESLRYINVSRTDFNTSHLEELVRECKLLQGLDISQTGVRCIRCLVSLQNSLQTLKMHRMGVCDKTIIELKKLRILDISSEDDRLVATTVTGISLTGISRRIRAILTHPDALPDLVYLDVSGRYPINFSELRSFILKRPNLKFLGILYDEPLCAEPMFRDKSHVDFNPNLKVAGSASKDQLMVSLDSYRMRAEYVYTIIHNLITFGSLYDMHSIEVRTEFIRLILNIIQQNGEKACLSSVYCLSYLTKHDLNENFHPNLLLDIVSLCLELLEKYPNDLALHKYALVILNQNGLEDLEGIDRFKCCKFALDSLCTHKNETVIKMAVSIAATLATRMTNEETSKIGTNKLFMKKLLSIIKEKTSSLKVDTTFNTTLTTLWNLTDESPKTCTTFIASKGLQLFESVLDAFSEDSDIERDIIGILSNIAEVKTLRKKLLKPKFVSRLRNFLKCEDIDTSFYAGDILAHLVSDGDQSWTLEDVSRSEILEELHSEIKDRWKSPGCEIAAYRSFTPYIHLLKCPEAPVQLFGVWAIHHVCVEKPSRYVPLLREDKLCKCLDDLVKMENLQVDVKEIVYKLVGMRDNLSQPTTEDSAS